jgi:hypothetical protein
LSNGNTAYVSENGVLFDKSKTIIIACLGGKTGSYNIPNSVTTVGDVAFFGCISLTSITIPNSVTTIGACAFLSCSSLRNVVALRTSPPALGDDTFYNVPLSSATLTVPNGIKAAYQSAEGWNGFGTIVEMDDGEINSSKMIQGETGPLTWALDNGTLTISGTGDMPDFRYTSDTPWYKYCDTITTINIQNGVTTIGENAFAWCRSLTSITIPNSVINIGYHAFSQCLSLTSITIPNSVTTIGSSAFSGCDSLTSITIPNSVTTIGRSAFSGCDSLTSITIPNSVTTIGEDAFRNCRSLISITIPNSVTTIGKGAFSGCRSLTSITIPNLVTTIGDNAFQGCISLTSVTIGNLVTTIGYYAFGGCSSLRDVVVLRTTPPSIAYRERSGYEPISTFSYVPLISSTLTVPKGSKAAYQSANGWKKFGTIVEMDDSEINSNAMIQGQTGPLTWTLENGTLTIGGTGNMPDFDDTSDIPWCSYRDTITVVNIQDGVTSIGDKAFDCCNSLTSITIGNSVITIGNRAFDSCSSLTSITVDRGYTMYISEDWVLFNKSKTKIIYCCPIKLANVNDAWLGS